MRIILLVFLSAIFLIGCNDKPVKIQDATGAIKDIYIILEDEEWDNGMGDSIRQALARPIDGLVRPEPLFNLQQISPANFEGMIKKKRMFLRFKQRDSASTGLLVNPYASPQVGIEVSAPTRMAQIKQFKNSLPLIINEFNKSDYQHKIELMKKVASPSPEVEKKFDIDLVLPNYYNVAKADKDFIWLRRLINEGTMDLMFYELPLDQIRRDSSTIQDIIKVRDSVGAERITTKTGVFRTQPAFTPFLNQSSIDGKFAYRTAGTWDISDQWVAGPFVNYAIYNDKKGNWLIAEGYLSSPNSTQRDKLFELEAIINSIKFK